MRWSSHKKIEVIFHLQKIENVFYLQNNWRHFLFTIKMSSSILSLVNTSAMLWFTFEVTFEQIPGGWVAGKELAQSSWKWSWDLNLTINELMN